MKRCLNFAVLIGSLVTAAMLTAQTPARMALPAGGLNPPAMNAPPQNAKQPAKSAVQPVSGTPAKTAAAPTTAVKPLLMAAQPTIVNTPAAIAPAATTPAVPTATPAATPTVPVSTNPFDPTPTTAPAPASPQPEWRYAQKPDLTNQPRYDRTALLGPDDARSPNRIRDCLLKASAEVQLPAQEAGVLVELQAFEGQEVKQQQILGRIDDSQPRLQKKAAEAERNVSIEKSKSTINEQYALKASDVARKEWEKAEESNRIAPGSVSQVEVMRLKLTWEKGLLERERAQEERKIENLTVMAKDVDVEAADDAIRRRHLIAPIPGTVVELTPHIGEWLKPGDPVLKIVNMEVLKIEGYVNITNHLQQDLRNQLVDAEVDLGQQKVTVKARITFVSPVVEAGGEYRIKAEIQNRKTAAGEWELKPGLNADIILDKKNSPAAAAGAPRLP